MIKYFGDFWTSVYGASSPNGEFIEALDKCYVNQELQNTEYIRYVNNAISRHTISKTFVVKNRMVVYDEDQLDDQHYVFDGTLTFDGAKLFSSKPADIFRLRLPSTLTDPSFIADDPVKPSVILQAGIDFIFEDGFIYLREDARNMGFVKGVDTSTPPKETMSLWFLNCGGFRSSIQNIYGKPIGAATFNNVELNNVYWDMLVEGCSSENMGRMLCVITDTDYLSETGDVQEIFEENDRITVVVNDKLFTSPKAAGVLVSIGDSVKKGQFIFGNARVYDKGDDLPESLFPIMHMSEAMVGSEVEGGVCIENKPTDLPSLRNTFLEDPAGMDDVVDRVSGDPLFMLSNSSGWETIQFTEEPYIKYEIIRVLSALPFRGSVGSVLAFLRKINEIALARRKTLLDIFYENSTGASPQKINLFEQYRRNLFGSNAVFVFAMTELAPDGMDPAAPLAFLKRVMNAGTSMLTFFESNSIVEYPLNAISDSVETFLVPDTLSDTFDGVSSFLRTG